MIYSHISSYRTWNCEQAIVWGGKLWSALDYGFAHTQHGGLTLAFVFYRFHSNITDEICDMILRKKAFTFEAPSRETYLLIYQSLIDSKQYLSIYIKWDASWGKEIVNFLVSKSCISMTGNVFQRWFSEKWMSAR